MNGLERVGGVSLEPRWCGLRAGAAGRYSLGVGTRTPWGGAVLALGVTPRGPASLFPRRLS